MSKLDDILSELTFHPSDIEMDNERRKFMKRQMKDLMLELIGEDQKVTPTKHLHSDGEFYQRKYRPTERNALRAELREKVEAL